MTLDSTLRPVAEDLINQFGKTLVLRRQEQETYDPITDTMTGAATDYVIKGIVEDFKAHQVTGLVEVGDRKILVAARGLNIVPRPQDAVMMDGETYPVLNVTSTYSGEQAATYELHIRG